MKNTLYSNSQIQAIHHGKGSMMVLAGPGSGKTTVITGRTKYLIEEFGVNPSNILVITFTKAAALEMQTRFEKMISSKSMVTFGTFHAVFFKILKYAYNYSADNILREELKYQYIREIIERMGLEYEDENEFINSILSEISMVKGDMISIDHYYSKNCSDVVFKKIYEKYEQKLRIINKIDFDDMLVMCYELLKAREDILKLWQDKYKYILIDEFQDINKVQYEVIKMLAKPLNNLFIVGDDDQSIYRFRGARPEIMINFTRDFPETVTVVLRENYRSTGNIVKASSKLIANNRNRFNKEIVSANEEGELLVLQEFNSHMEENERIIELIKKHLRDGGKLSDIAILFRTNIGPRYLVHKFMENNIAFRMKDSLPNIYEHWIAKNIITYIMFSLGKRNRGDFFTIMNKPNRYISRDAVSETEVSFEKLEKYYFDKEWMLDRIGKLEYDLQMLRKMSPYTGITYICKAIGYNEYLKDYAECRHINTEELMDVVEELRELSKPFKSYEEWFQHIEDYEHELRKQADMAWKGHDCIECLTMHSAKGLEYEIVFIIDANEGVTPHKKAVLEDDIEEERRMFYVAMTRAKKRLYIFSTKEQYGKPANVSRFVEDIS
ncbi:MAG: ATP-dependent helicase [Lachnospiraceae bacterium]|nr:ATP-dependent helicase [Lachnospiraceae bacterium]